MNIIYFLLFLGEPFTKWRNCLDTVVNVINFHNEQSYRTVNQMLNKYFTLPTVNIPQSSSKMYAFNINDKVVIDALPRQRKDLSFKYTLNRGN